MLIEHIAQFRKDEDGAVAIIVSLLLVVLLGFTALGVDVASLYRERAVLQSTADLTAVSAMAVPDTATARAQYVLTRNGKTTQTLQTLQTGRFLRNPDIAAGDRFTPLPQGSPGINATSLVLQDNAPLHFARIFSNDTHVALDRTSLATRTGSASFALDSHILHLEGTTLNSALISQFGASAAIDLGVIDGLAEASVNLGDLLTVLDSATGGPRRNPAAILDTTTTGADLIAALQSVLPASLATALSGVRGATGAARFDVASLVGGIDTDLGLTVSEFLAQVDVSALDVIRAVIGAQGAGGVINVDSDINIADVLSTKTRIMAGEPAAHSGVIAMGEEGVQLHRAAVRLSTDMALSADLLSGLGVGVQVTQVNLPIYTEIAGTSATLDQIGCNVTSSQNIAASFITDTNSLHPANGTAVAALYLGDLPDGSGAINPADLGFADIVDVNITIDLGLLPDIEIAGLTLQARSAVTVGASLNDTVTFTINDVAHGETVKTFGSGTLLSSTVSSLLSPANTEFRVKPDQSGLVSGLVAPVVNNLLAALPQSLFSGLTTPVDAALDATLAAAGVELGAGELKLIGHHCEPIRLVR